VEPADQQFDLKDYSTVEDVQAAIGDLDYKGGDTDPVGVLNYVRTNMLTLAAGDRPDVRNVVVFLTDGGSTESPQVCTMCKLIKNFLSK